MTEMTKMTMDEFIREARELKWFVDRLCQLRTMQKYKDSTFSVKMCPITAVCYKKYGVFYPMYAYRNAARTLGLSEHDTNWIVGAADNASAQDSFRSVLWNELLVDTKKESA